MSNSAPNVLDSLVIVNLDGMERRLVKTGGQNEVPQVRHKT
jgi:hypothetical protein